MSVSGVNAASASSYTKDVDPNLGDSNLGIDDFLKLLTAQLQNQNMMEPVSDTEFIAQMAQFSTLQQMKELAGMFQSTQAMSYVGENVIVKSTDEDGNLIYISGFVKSVNLEEETPYLLIGDKYYKMSDVTDVYTNVPVVDNG